MANKFKGEVAIELDKVRKLKFNTNALAHLEDSLGFPLSEMASKPSGVKTIVKMFWAGLLHESPDLTEEQAMEIMDYTDFGTVSEKVTEAIDLAFGQNKESQKN